MLKTVMNRVQGEIIREKMRSNIQTIVVAPDTVIVIFQNGYWMPYRFPKK